MNLNEISHRYSEVKKQIETICVNHNIDLSTITILAVSKFQSTDKIKYLNELGQKHFGENYVQEAINKQQVLRLAPLSWHFIGHLQKNKVKDVVGQFEMIHSVDSMELAIKISQKASEKNIIQKILLEINLSNEKTKNGFFKDQLLNQIQLISKLPQIMLSGLMLLPPPVEDPEQVRSYFRDTKELFLNLQNLLIPEQKKYWKYLSMGTSQDYLIAIQEGANIIRLGTVLFGERE